MSKLKTKVNKRTLDDFAKATVRTVENQMRGKSGLNRSDDEPTVIDYNYFLADEDTLDIGGSTDKDISQAYQINIKVFGFRPTETFVSKVIQRMCREHNIQDDETYYQLKYGVSENPPENLDEAYCREFQLFIIPKDGVEFVNED